MNSITACNDLCKQKSVTTTLKICKAVSDTSFRTIVKKMGVQGFYDNEDCSSMYKNTSPRAHMNNISDSNFRRGSYLLFYKCSHGTDE